MPTFAHMLLLLPLTTIGSGVAAQEQAVDAPLQVVEVKASPQAYDPRRDDTATKIVVRHEDIVKYGDSTIVDVLKRLPGVSVGGVPGRGGDIRLRGMGSGYTQILLNGEPTPPGFALDGVAPELIERIEILRAASAEFSTQSIAGTINIVLKRTIATRQRELKTALQSQDGRPGTNVNLTLADQLGIWSYAVAGGLAWSTDERPATGFTSVTSPDGTALERRDQAASMRGRYRGVNLAPRVTAKLGASDALAWQSFLAFNDYGGPGSERTSTSLGAAPAFQREASSLAQRTVLARSDVSWTHKGAADATLVLKAGVNLGRRTVARDVFRYDGDGDGDGDDALALQRSTASRPRDRGVTFGGNYAMPIGDRHALTAGWDSGWSGRSEQRTEHDQRGQRDQLDLRDQASAAPASVLDQRFAASVVRLALFAQDEWTIDQQWSLYLGLRWEGIRTRSSGVDNTAAVWSPVLQTLYKLSDTTRDRLRLALTRTYRAPLTSELLPRRVRAIENSATTPDEQGNPRLKPELAWGLDLAFEHDLTGGGLLGVSAYLRHIQDNSRNNIFLVDGLWLSMPINNGKAQAHGVEFEAKGPLRSLFKTAPAIELRANLARNWSSLASLPGPNNRLVSQTPVSANIGLDYTPHGLPLTLGASYHFQNGGPVRFSLNEFDYSTPRRLLDLYALVRLHPKAQVRLSVTNALHQRSMTALTWVDGNGARTDATLTPSATVLRAALELKL